MGLIGARPFSQVPPAARKRLYTPWDTGRDPLYSYGNGSQLMASVNSLASTLQQQLADALTAALPDAGTADPLLRRSDRADFQANGILALAKKLKGNPASSPRRSRPRSRRAT